MKYPGGCLSHGATITLLLMAADVAITPVDLVDGRW